MQTVYYTTILYSVLQAVLDQLKKGEGSRTSEESLLLANTYDPDDDPKNNKKSNKKRQQERQNEQKIGGKINQKGVENKAFSESENPDKIESSTKRTNNKTRKAVAEEEEKPSVTVSKKKRDTDKEAVTEKDEISKPTSKVKTESEHTTQTERRKKKLENEDQGTKADKKPVKQSRGKNEEKEDVEAKAEKTEGEKKVKKKKRTKKPKEAEEAAEPQIKDDGKVVCMIVHRTDKLKTDFYVSHPMIRVHVVDEQTGNYVKKQSKKRAVASYYEAENDNVDFIIPIMTQPFDFKANRSTLPVWEESMVLNENFNYLIQPEPKVLLLFELVDFMSMNAAKQKSRRAKDDGGWHRIAWGFLRLLGANGQPNIERKLRLQLFQVPLRFNTLSGQLDIYQWWKSAQRLTYPSTLYVTVKAIIPPDKVVASGRSMIPIQQETGKITYDELQRTMDLETSGGHGETTRRKGPTPWTRLTGQVCKVPNDLALSLPTGRMGCFVLAFSPDGKSLACGCHDRDSHPILVYEIPSGHQAGRFLGHASLIYDIAWARNSKQLVSASADGTAKVWNMETVASSPAKILPHPSFVYSAKYHVRVEKIIVTGGFDSVIRVWTLQGGDPTAQLLQELDGHTSNVNSLCFSEEGEKLYSADGSGEIRIWNAYVTEKPSSSGVLKPWLFDKVIADPELKGVPINAIVLHPNGRRLLIQGRDNTLRMFDLRVSSVTQKYHGALNFRERVRCSVSPCGSFLFAGSEDGRAYVWNTDTGDQVAMYSNLGYTRPVSDVAYHPLDHMIALCGLGEGHQVLMYRYDFSVAQREVNLIDTDLRPSPRRALQLTARDATDSKSDEDPLETSRSRKLMTSLHMEESLRKERVLKKLKAVSAFKDAAPGTVLMSPRQQPGETGLMSTWGSTFDTALQPSLLHPEPSMFSPHATTTLGSAVANQQLVSSQTEYMKSSQGSWRPGFTGVGTPTPVHGRQPTLSMKTSSVGKPEFTFQAVKGVPSRSELVVALYDYQAQRSDELSLLRGDLIKVLYKDSASWWMGELASGQQGFLLANYVVSAEEYDSREEDPVSVVVEGSTSPRNPEDSESDSKKRHVSAVVSRSGGLQFLSGTEDSGDETPTRKGRKKRKSKIP